MASPFPRVDATDPFVPVAKVSALETKGRMTVKAAGKQIALFKHGERILACNNRCPHEGYPLVEGSLAGTCILTCNWHNWKFDLETGQNLLGGDALRRYDVEVRGGEIFLDLSDPAAEVRIDAALKNLKDAFPRHEYDRMAREIARLEKAGGDPLEAVRAAIRWTHDHLEFGDTHAPAAAADWLTLRRDEAGDDVTRLAPVLEIVDHLSWDSMREPAFPYPAGSADYDPDTLVAAIDGEDEAAALAQVRGALRQGLGYDDVEPALARAALAHYQDFGHPAIYTVKFGDLLRHLGPAVQEPLLLQLVRGMVYARREELIPEFRHYAAALAAWDGRGTERVTAVDFRGLSIDRALDRCVAASGDAPALYAALLGAAAWNMLHYDSRFQDQTTGSVSQNIGWLDFTHAITFANAVRRICSKQPALWPLGLLQMACFLGRNAAFIDADLDVTGWYVADAAAFLSETRRGLFDHGQFEYIVSAHLVKTTMAVSEELAADPGGIFADDLVAALNRFLHSPIKRKHVLRTARQSVNFVDAEG